ncbi:hypothetical protein M9H77_08045 [Catharanthus roseus]|uniref:Uncharacterized protein n=1 Tax=Catharanthus roseus TaxID=4058 RepID=A0ACC0BWP7_CATRO|nr:hypothetical protein M9H77_08045 [Catharanthus roseus]
MALEKPEEVKLFANHTTSCFARNFSFMQDAGAPSKDEEKRLVYDSIKTISFFPYKSYFLIGLRLDCASFDILHDKSIGMHIEQCDYVYPFHGVSMRNLSNASNGFVMQVSILQSQIATSFNLTGISFFSFCNCQFSVNSSVAAAVGRHSLLSASLGGL